MQQLFGFSLRALLCCTEHNAHIVGAGRNLVGGGWEGGDLNVINGCAQIFLSLVNALILHFLFFPVALLFLKTFNEFTKSII